MLVYGVRCAPADLQDLPANAQADFYLDYGLLVFPAYTRPTVVQGRPSEHFWNEVARVVDGRVHVVDIEQPYITEDEDAVVRALRRCYPGLTSDWFHVPRSA